MAARRLSPGLLPKQKPTRTVPHAGTPLRLPSVSMCEAPNRSGQLGLPEVAAPEASPPHCSIRVDSERSLTGTIWSCA